MKDLLRLHIIEALESLGIGGESVPTFEKPRLPGHGDLTTNIAMSLAKQVRMSPRDLAAKIIGRIGLDPALVERVEIAGPGFINFHFTSRFYQSQIGDILRSQSSFGRSVAGLGLKTQVEFVSANPTGPLTVGHGRGAVYGDTVARLLEWTNHDVTREYYFNNAGRQMRILGDSVRLRYLELIGTPSAPFPEEYYQGEYIRDIAEHLRQEFGESLREENAEGRFKATAEREIFEDIKRTLSRLSISHDVYYNENSLYESGKIDEVIRELKDRGLAYAQDGALWFKASSFGSDKDKVIVKSTGEPTYRLPDIAYHREKLRRGFGLVIDILGADHVASYPDVIAGLKALECDPSRIKVLIHQFVTIVEGGQVVKMSTRKANFITLDELIDEVGADVVRYFFLMRGIGSHLNFDLKLAKERSDDNPVYYLQYAHARIAGIVRLAEAQGISPPDEKSFSLLDKAEELDLIRQLVMFPDIIESCAATFEPHRLAEYLQDTAGFFHKFYHFHRVVGDDVELSRARLALCQATKVVIANGLGVLGITAPVTM